jgi:hypothetical protein
MLSKRVEVRLSKIVYSWQEGWGEKEVPLKWRLAHEHKKYPLPYGFFGVRRLFLTLR